MKRCIYIGGFYLPNQEEEIRKIAIKNIIYSANTFEWSFIKGLIHFYKDIEFWSFPFLPNYPKGIKEPYTYGKSETIDGFKFRSFSSLRLPVINLLFKAFSLFLYILFHTKKVRGRIVIVYSTHLPFTLSFPLLKMLGCKIVQIVPDLTIYQSSNTNKLYLMLKKAENYLFNKLVSHADAMVVVADAMMGYFQYLKIPMVRIEGMYDITVEQNSKQNFIIKNRRNLKKQIFYAGSLDKRYGLINLVDCFIRINDPNTELWICGNGDQYDNMKEYSNQYSNIKFFGQLSHDEVVALYQQIDILVNPRKPEGEYTKYSFPIKTMEYLASTKPVVMYDLPGLPDEYKPFLFLVPDTDKGLMDTLRFVLTIDDDKLSINGNDARHFIIESKSPIVQISKLKDLIENI